MDFYSAIKPLYYVCKLSGVATFSMERRGGFAVRLKDKVITVAISGAFFYINIYTLSDYFGISTTVIGVSSGILGFFELFNHAVTFIVMYATKEQVVGCFQGLVHVDFCLKDAVGSHPEYVLARQRIVCCIASYLFIVSLGISYTIYVIYKSIGEVEIGIEDLPVYLIYFAFYAFSYFLNMSKMSMICFFVLEIRKRFEHINTNFSCEPLKIRRLMKTCTLLRITSRKVNSIFQLLILTKIVTSGTEVLNTLFILCTGMVLLVDDEYLAIFSLIWSCGSVLEVVFIVYGFWAIRVEVRHNV